MVSVPCCLLQAAKKWCAMGKKGVEEGAGKSGKMAVEKQLNDIRKFRDEVLERYAAGRVLEWAYYYVVSPPVVWFLDRSERLQKFLNQRVRPFLAEKCRSWTPKGEGFNG